MEFQRAAKTNRAAPRKRSPIATGVTPTARTPMHPILQLQQKIGNRAVGRLIQAKLRVGQPGDQYEQEADRVAEVVMRMPEPRIQRVCTECEEKLQRQPMEEEEEEAETLQTKPLAEQITPLVQRQAEPMEKEKEEEETLQTKPLAKQIKPLVQRQTEPMDEEEEEEMLQTKTTSGQPPTVSSRLQNRITALQGGGQPLSQSERAFFEPRFGADFSQVRVHSDSQAAETASAVNARAFTLGRDVVLGAGQYQPSESEGRRLLAHELTHVVQQNNSDGAVIQTKKKPKVSPGHALIGAAAQTPTKSVSEYGNKIIDILKKDKQRKLSIQDAVRQAAEDSSIGLAAPTIAEAGDKGQSLKSSRKLALIIANSNYQKPNTSLPNTVKQATQMQSQLKLRGYKIQKKIDLSTATMSKIFNQFIKQAKRGDDIVIFFSGHGQVKGMQGTDNKFVAPAIVAGWKNQALIKQFQLTVIIEACHSGAITDLIRTEESIRLKKLGTSRSTKVVSLAIIAQKLQQIKDRLAKLERRKQSLMEKPLVDKLIRKKTLKQETRKQAKIIKDAWNKALPQIKKLAKKVKNLSAQSLKIPTFSGTPKWLNTKQLDTLDTMTNQTLALARQELANVKSAMDLKPLSPERPRFPNLVTGKGGVIEHRKKRFREGLKKRIQESVSEL